MGKRFRKVRFYWKQYWWKWNGDTQILSPTPTTAGCVTSCSVILDLEQEFSLDPLQWWHGWYFPCPFQGLAYLILKAFLWDQLYCRVTDEEIEPREATDLWPKPFFSCTSHVRLWLWTLRPSSKPFQTPETDILCFIHLLEILSVVAMGMFLFLEASSLLL